MARLQYYWMPLFMASLIVGCASPTAVNAPPLVQSATQLPNGQASHITVQHILVGFEGSLPGKIITRTQPEAYDLALDIMRQAEGGADFSELVSKYTDDSPPGIYHLANHGQPSNMLSQDPSENVSPRNRMVPAFGDVGFPLAVGEIGLAEHHPRNSPFGWHIIKRLK